MNTQNDNFFWRGVLVFVCLIAMVVALFLPCASVEATLYQQHNLVSDLTGVADFTDTNLVNPWGIASSPTSPFWISDNGTGLSTLYNGAGQPNALVVTIGIPPSAPTGVVFNSTAISGDFGGAHFIFAMEDGGIASWTSGTSAVLEQTISGAAYKGIAIGSRNISGNLVNFLYAANFLAGTIDVFDSSYQPVNIPGGFADPTLPAGYAPFNIQNINGNLYVTYALQKPGTIDPLVGAGHGFVDVYDTDGNIIKRLITDDVLNSPWGMAIAPIGLFGGFSGDLLVGNFGDGRINAFDPVTGANVGTVEDVTGNPLVIPGLWGLRFGNGAQGFDPSSLYFTAGGNIEDHGLFGSISIQAVPEPSTFLLLGIGLAGVGLLRRRFKK